MARPKTEPIERIKKDIIELKPEHAEMLLEWLEMVMDVRTADTEAAKRREQKKAEGNV